MRKCGSFQQEKGRRRHLFICVRLHYIASIQVWGLLRLFSLRFYHSLSLDKRKKAPHFFLYNRILWSQGERRGKLMTKQYWLQRINWLAFNKPLGCYAYIRRQSLFYFSKATINATPRHNLQTSLPFCARFGSVN